MPHTPVTGSAAKTVPRTQHDHPPWRLLALRHKLEHHREFRREQLAQLEAAAESAASPSPVALADRTTTDSPALREVATSVATGARQALANIEEALAGMADGHYGICRACRADIPLPLLEAIPETLLCLNCRHLFERGEAPAAHHHPSGRRYRSPRTVRRPQRRHHGFRRHVGQP